MTEEQNEDRICRRLDKIYERLLWACTFICLMMMFTYCINLNTMQIKRNTAMMIMTEEVE